MSQVSLPTEPAKAVAELEAEFPGRVSVEHNDAGAIVSIEGVELGSSWSPDLARLSFLLPFHYPDCAIYPYYVTGALPQIADQALRQISWRGAPAIQVSLRHNHWNPAHDTALGSVLLTLARLRRQ